MDHLIIRLKSEREGWCIDVCWWFPVESGACRTADNKHTGPAIFLVADCALASWDVLPVFYTSFVAKKSFCMVLAN